MITVCAMTEADIAEAAALEKAIFSMPWSVQAFSDTLRDAKARYVAAKEDGMLVGYCGAYLIAGEGNIMNVAVAKEKRGRGIAAWMLQKLMEESMQEGILEFTLEVRESNAAAIRLYSRLGFQIEGIRKNFYEKPMENALIMWKRQEA